MCALRTCMKNARWVFSKRNMTILRTKRITPRPTHASQSGAAISVAMRVGNLPLVRYRLASSLLTPRSNDHCTDLWWLALAIFLVCIAEVRFFFSPYPWTLVNDQVRVGECVGLINLSNSAAS